ncbi:MAG: LptF/LptG family permease [Oscillatoriaceae bacterium SKW80]|nr:LptF/LptG family permease [Oscillatoriaceae bacterium SKYG93]MCX8121601.1 LptF/LptG family permease [Oscillatoriaceae bacterium SKW80]MDW8453909.1 LptF/LptG family permease [Oscillatoriaceae cyanobacterium SKYGB_i_bin93]HIK28848.1 LptF/LptG family permease [Oscillatoriaceae cyanobacterium M7585_C2015_266]
MKLTLSNSSSSVSWFAPRITVMDRYIITELLPPFLFGVGTFSSLGLAIGTMFDLVRKITESGLPVAIALKIMALKFPYFIVLAFPMSMLLSTLLTYSRLSSDSELIALRSCGVSIYRLVLPAVVMSFFVTGLTFFFNELLVPAANYEASITLNQALKKETKSFQEKNIIYPEFGKIKQKDGKKEEVLLRLFYAEEFDGERMKGLTILERSQPNINQILVAEYATWNVETNTWKFFNGTIYFVAPDGSYRNIGKFKQQEVALPRTPLDLANKKRDYNEMNIAESLEYLNLLRQSGKEQKIRKLLIRIQQKFSLPFACVAFALVGAALGTKPQRTSKATGFGICVVLVFSYYVLMSIGDALGLSGILSPVMAGWLPTLCGFGMGVVVLVRASQ